MHTLPPAMILLLRPFAPLFSKRVSGLLHSRGEQRVGTCATLVGFRL